MGLLHRTSQQFHWENRGYGISTTSSPTSPAASARTSARNGAQAQAFGGSIRALTGDDTAARALGAFWRFYQDTGARKWGTPYLTRRFFDIVQRDHARRRAAGAGRARRAPVAGALNFIGARDALRPLLGLRRASPLPAFRAVLLPGHRLRHRPRPAGRGRGAGRTQAGAGLPADDHPFAALDRRRRLPPRGRRSILEAERAAVDEEIEMLTAYGPFRRDRRDEAE